MNRDEIMLEAGLRLAEELCASAVVSFVDVPGCSGVIPAYQAQHPGPGSETPETLDALIAVLRERLASAAATLALPDEEEGDGGAMGLVVGVFHEALLVLSLDEVRSRFDLSRFEAIVPRNVMAAILRLAIELGREGREGKPLGTAFIVGDSDAILSISHQLVLNPYLGHPPEVTTILDRANWESVKEFALLDGMFVVDASGTVIAAGRYLDVDAKSVRLPSGLGGRHRAAAAATLLAPAVAVVVSESGGTVRVFSGGVCWIEIRPALSAVGRLA